MCSSPNCNIPLSAGSVLYLVCRRAINTCSCVVPVLSGCTNAFLRLYTEDSQRWYYVSPDVVSISHINILYIQTHIFIIIFIFIIIPLFFRSSSQTTLFPRFRFFCRVFFSDILLPSVSFILSLSLSRSSHSHTGHRAR